MTQAGKFPVMGNVSYFSTGLVVVGGVFCLFVCCLFVFFLMNSQNI